MIHVLGRVASVICALAFVYLGVRLLDRADLGDLLGDARFSLPMFLLAVSLSASWQLAFGPYVADYSRYLPRSTSARATFWWTLSGSALGSQWSMTRSACWSRRPAAARSSTTRSGTLVSLGGAGLVASFFCFVIALGKLTSTCSTRTAASCRW
ncbi:cytosine permease [Streptomyces sp. KL116D]|uniref:cytosine permease n=1 Tax=Streptomyces sp. KL116D TaxID=3045152 RepID=UPI0035570D15